MLQYKNTLGSVKGIDTKTRKVEGYFADFDSKDSDGDVFVKGAFKKSINDNGPNATGRIKHLLQHDVLQPIGKVIELFEDAKGLRFISEIPDTTLGLDVLKLYDAGVYNEHSVGFFPISDKMEKRGDTTYFKEVKLMEGSTVTWGANENTPLIGIKSMQSVDYVQSRLGKLQKALKDGTFTDSTFQLLEIEFNQLENYLKTLNKEKPSVDTLDVIEPFETQKFLNEIFKIK